MKMIKQPTIPPMPKRPTFDARDTQYNLPIGTDLISRAQAIDAVNRLSLGETDATRLAMRIGDYLERLPSAALGTNLAEVGTDLISRQAAIDALDRLRESTYSADYGIVDCDDAINAIAALPPTEPKKGKWIKVGRWGRVYKCNRCGNLLDFDGVNAGRGSTNFCPNCGSYNGGEHDG